MAQRSHHQRNSARDLQRCWEGNGLKWKLIVWTGQRKLEWHWALFESGWRGQIKRMVEPLLWPRGIDKLFGQCGQRDPVNIFAHYIDNLRSVLAIYSPANSFWPRDEMLKVVGVIIRFVVAKYSTVLECQHANENTKFTSSLMAVHVRSVLVDAALRDGWYFSMCNFNGVVLLDDHIYSACDGYFKWKYSLLGL